MKKATMIVPGFSRFDAVGGDELQAVSGGWCGNDPKYWGPGPRPPIDPYRDYLGGMQLPGVDARIGGQLGIAF